MASLYKVPREFARISRKSLRHNGSSRSFRTCSRSLAAQNFTMPAMSPTMTEGNIASWKVKEGDSFSTGDVLLEIETDKAQMDVEAQDDGKMAKITQPDGSKGVKVGTRIGVIAETDDDLSSISIPAEDSAPSQQETKPETSASKSTESQAEAPPSSSKSEDRSSSSPPQSSGPSKQTYPLYPSITQLLHANGIPESDVDKIPASGPKGRLLKGDVLSYIGSISKSYSSDQSARIKKLAHLDLSNIQTVPSKPPPPAEEKPASAAAAPATALAPEPDTEVAVSISMKAVLEVQKRIHDTLGVMLPLSTFIARATEVANDDLPQSASKPPTADELFNQVLGLDKVGGKTSRGRFMPQVAALPANVRTATTAAAAVGPLKKPDIIDILSGRTTAFSARMGAVPQGLGAGLASESTSNVFSVTVAKGEEKRARVFLERVKTILQVEPGSLVI